MYQSNRNRIHRRSFLKKAGCGAMSGLPILSSILNLKLLNHASAASMNTMHASEEDEKTIVCAFMSGGNDSFNMLVPRDDRYDDYALARSNLALDKGSLLPINQIEGGDGFQYGLHHNAPRLQELFNGLEGDPNKRRLSFISNIGTLVEPTTLEQYKNESVRLPHSLGSHIDQEQQWQTSVPQGLDFISGWGGRIADVLHDTHNQDNISMGISLKTKSTFQIGRSTQQFVITDRGSERFSGSANTDPFFQAKNQGQRSILEQQYSNLIQYSFADITSRSDGMAEFFQKEFETFDESVIPIPFSNSPIGRQLEGAFKSIALRSKLGLKRQTLFVGEGGFDNHLNLLSRHTAEMNNWSESLYAFQRAIEAVGLQDSVVTFVGSDFGRTMRSNGRGTDHAWGGNTLVMGGAVQGGQVLGTFPNLALDGPDDIGQGGRYIPTTSVDELFAEIAMWFGVSNTDLQYVLPNIENFYTIGSGAPIGFLEAIV